MVGSVCKVISEFRVKNYAVLKLDEDKPLKKYSKHLIDGLEYEIVQVFDVPRCIAIESNNSFLNKEIKFI